MGNGKKIIIKKPCIDIQITEINFSFSPHQDHIYFQFILHGENYYF